MEINEFKDHLVETIEMQAEWRDRKAEEYPDDDRNKQSATGLRALAKHIKALPVDAPKLIRLWDRWYGLRATTDDDVFSSMREAETEVLRLYGFDTPEDDGDPDAFLDQVIDAIENVWATQ